MLGKRVSDNVSALISLIVRSQTTPKALAKIVRKVDTASIEAMLAALPAAVAYIIFGDHGEEA